MIALKCGIFERSMPIRISNWVRGAASSQSSARRPSIVLTLTKHHPTLADKPAL